MSTMDDYQSDAEIQWCPGCPNFGILQAFKKAFVSIGKDPHEICLVSGIGQAAKLPHYLKCNFFNGLHGRAIPVALGVHAANPDLKTIVVAGDGDCYGEGGNHFLHTLRRNPDITVVVHNNEVYALTKGQASPTTPKGERRTLQFNGVQVPPLQMLAVAILHGCTFVARGFALEVDHLQDLLVSAVEHPGLSLVEVVQPCITWGTHPLKWYQERVRIVKEDYDPTDRSAAMELAMTWGETIPIGILYQSGPVETFGHDYRHTVTDRPLTELKPLDKGLMEKMLSEFRL
ncbi:MAG: 2-oxoacid ferredoxin oxidoreductase [Deltaproteobacteria bacterium]|nr:2-oxoacid ferredoxin oxidoreductase [Deltaproteobacteria bacterium]